MLEYANAYYRYVEEWDRLCIMRDRAYLAANEGNWDAVIEASTAAIESLRRTDQLEQEERVATRTRHDGIDHRGRQRFVT